MTRADYLLLAREPGEPDLSTVAGLAAWIERARSIAFFAGKRHDEISLAEAQWLFPYVRRDFPCDSGRPPEGEAGTAECVAGQSGGEAASPKV